MARKSSEVSFISPLISCFSANIAPCLTSCLITSVSSFLEHDVRKKNRISQNRPSLTEKLCHLRFLFIGAFLNKQLFTGTHGTAIKLLMPSSLGCLRNDYRRFLQSQTTSSSTSRPNEKISGSDLAVHWSVMFGYTFS